MSMIKRAKTGEIEELAGEGIASEQPTPVMEWAPDVVIKDVLDVPTSKESNIDINLDEDDADEIAVRV
jgi:hypothetical protein